MGELEKLDEDVEVSERLVLYRNTINDPNGLWITNPAIPRDEVAKIKSLYTGTPDVFFVLSMFCVLGFLMTFAPGVAYLFQGESERQFALNLLMGAGGTSLLPLIMLIRSHLGHKRKDDALNGRSLSVHVSYPLGLAWQDWLAAQDKINEIDANSDAASALAEQEPIVRAALTAYIEEENLSSEQSQKFEGWFMVTCAEARALSKAEERRAEAHKQYAISSAIAVALETPSPLPAAREQSQMLTNTVREVLDRS